MPDQHFHIRKRDRFRNSGEHLRSSGPPDSADAAVQDFFYAGMHDVERFLSLFGFHTNHRLRRELFVSRRIIQRRNRVSIADPSRLRRRTLARSRIERTVDPATEGFYFMLFAMRQLKTYGNLPKNTPIAAAVGGDRFADSLDVGTARALFLNLSRSLRRYESYLRREGLL
jgi:hypothetical protein